MAEIKGILLNAWVKFVNDRYGEEAVARCFENLSAEERRLVPSTFLDASWYPYESLHAFARVIRPLVTRSDSNFAEDIGRYMAQHSFTGAYRSLLAHDPIKQVGKFSSIAEFFFRGVYKLETEITGPTSCVARYRYEPGAKPTRGICTSLGGFWSRSLEMAGASKVAAAHPRCLNAGGDCCEFLLEWQPA